LILFFFKFFSFLCVCFELCVWSYGRGGLEQQKREKRDEKEEQHEEQLEEVSLLQSSPCKPTMVVEVCCHCHELGLLPSQRFFKLKK
jgi:hypothetical protein